MKWELHMYTSSHISMVIKLRSARWAGHVARTGEMRHEYKILVGKPEGSITLGRPRRRWKDITEIDFRKIRWEGVDWIYLT
jgi:hypothetical protein